MIADVQLKGILRLFALIARPFVRRRLAKFVLRPIKAMAEAETTAHAVRVAVRLRRSSGQELTAAGIPTARDRARCRRTGSW